MKIMITGLTFLTIILSLLYFTFGGEALLSGLITIGLVTLIFSCFSVGIWYAHQSIQLGARIVNEAINNNDQWDSVKMQSLAHFGGEIFKLKKDNQPINSGFPLLESDNDFGGFIISNVDEDE